MPVDRNRIALPRHSLLLLALLPALSAHAGNWQNNVAIGGFNSVNVYTPDTVSPVGNGRALLIVLHGCTQSITAFAGAKLEVAAETHGMVVAVPDAMHKAGFSCWNYWDATKSRSHQDYAKLISLANTLSGDAARNIDPNQVYIAKGRITWGAGYAACYLAFGNTAFVMREVAEGGQCRWVADGAPTCAGPLQACSSGGGGNGGGNDDGGGPPSGNPGAFSAGATSGYVKANASGGSVEVGAQAGYALGTGWDGKNNRSVLAFDTSAIPDNAVIERAYLVVTRASGAGTPWAGGNTLVVDARAGCFGAACGVAVDDYASAASASGVVVVPQFSSGSATSADFDAGGRAAINLAGTTELRLRFAAHPASGSYLFLSGTTAPVLHVEYSLPAQ